jgi:hypothetical protein
LHSSTQDSVIPCPRFIGGTQRLGAPPRPYRDPLPNRPQRRNSLYFRVVMYFWQPLRGPIGSPCCCPFFGCHVATRAGSISLRRDSKDAHCSTFRSIRSQCQRRFYRNRHLPSWQLKEQRTATPKVVGYSWNGGARSATHARRPLISQPCPIAERCSPHFESAAASSRQVHASAPLVGSSHVLFTSTGGASHDSPTGVVGPLCRDSSLGEELTWPKNTRRINASYRSPHRGPAKSWR